MCTQVNQGAINQGSIRGQSGVNRGQIKYLLSAVVDREARGEEGQHIAVDCQDTDRREETEGRKHRQLGAVTNSERCKQRSLQFGFNKRTLLENAYFMSPATEVAVGLLVVLPTTLVSDVMVMEQPACRIAAESRSSCEKIR